jgi:hypothetical protein
MSSASSNDTIARSERSSLGVAFAWPVLCTSGLGLVLLAAALQTGLVDASTWPMRALVAAGFDVGALCCTGAILFGFGMLARSVRGTVRALASCNDTSSLEQTLDGRLEAWQGATATVRAQQEALQSALVVLDQKLEAIRQEARVGSAKDAIFRLAASLDQLGARVDQRLVEVRASLQDGIQVVGQKVEAARDELGLRFQETIRSIGTLSAEETLAGAYDETFRYAEQGPETLGERSFREEAPRPGEVCVELEREHAQPMDLGVLESIVDPPTSTPPPAPRTEIPFEPRAVPQPAPFSTPVQPRAPASPLPSQPRKETPAPIPGPPPRSGGKLPLPRIDETWKNGGKAPR